MSKKFNEVWQVLHWFETHNPARARSYNPYEPERRGNSEGFAEDFCQDHPEMIFTKISGAIKISLKTFKDERCKDAFELVCLGRPLGLRLHPKEAAEVLGVHKRTIYKWLNRVHDVLKDQLKRRNLM